MLNYYAAFEPNVNRIDIAELKCMADNVYFEARNQIGEGQRAVAHVTLNRVKSRKFPNTVCGVVKQGRIHKNGHPVRHKCQFSWWCDGRSDNVQLTYTKGKMKGQIKSGVYLAYTYAVTEALAAMVKMSGDPTRGATYYYAHNIITPKWAKGFKMTALIQDHTFMSPRPKIRKKTYPKPKKNPRRK